ncbi:hypothetical protein C8J57DRAFT_1068192, partial [Mycena rebaudengoi]
RSKEIPSEDAIISAARILIEDSLSWTQGKAYASRTVQTSHEVLPDGCSWHSRSSAHSLPFDQFWSVLGHQWMPAKKAFNDEYIEKVTLVKTLSSTTSIWTIQYKFPPPLSPRVFTILQVTRLDDAYPRTGWVVHLPIDLTGPGDEALLAQEGHGIKGRYACVEKITQLPDGRTEWRLVTSNTPGGWIPKFLVEKTLPARISLVSPYAIAFWMNTDPEPGCHQLRRLVQHDLPEDAQNCVGTGAARTQFRYSAVARNYRLGLGSPQRCRVCNSVPLAVGRETPGPCDPQCHLGPR